MIKNPSGKLLTHSLKLNNLLKAQQLFVPPGADINESALLCKDCHHTLGGRSSHTFGNVLIGNPADLVRQMDIWLRKANHQWLTDSQKKGQSSLLCSFHSSVTLVPSSSLLDYRSVSKLW